MTVAVRASRSISTVASAPAFDTGKIKRRSLADVSEIPDLAGDTHLRKDRRSPIDGLAPFEAIEAVWKGQITVGLNRQLGAGDQLAVIEIEHARGEQQDERADEQAEIQM